MLTPLSGIAEFGGLLIPFFIINDVVETYIHQCSINVVTALPIYCYEERQASVWRQNIHTAILFMISW